MKDIGFKDRQSTVVIGGITGNPSLIRRPSLTTQERVRGTTLATGNRLRAQDNRGPSQEDSVKMFCRASGVAPTKQKGIIYRLDLWEEMVGKDGSRDGAGSHR